MGRRKSAPGRSRSIGSKILIRTIAVALLPLLVLSTVVFVGLSRLSETATEQVDESRELLSRESISVNAQDQAVSVAREINATLLERVEDVTDWARNPTIVTGLEAANQFADDESLASIPTEELEDRFNAARSTNVAPAAQRFLVDEIGFKPEFQEVFITDENGFNAALTARTSDFVQNDEEWWQDAWANGVSVADVEFDESANVFSVDVSVRIDHPDSGARLGVMKAVLSVAFVQSITTARSIGATEYTVVLDNGLLVAETDTFHSSERMMAPLPDDELSAGVVEALQTENAGALVTDETVYGYTRLTDANFLGREVLGFKGFNWIVVSNQRADVAFSPLRGLEDVNDEIDSSRSGLQGTVLIAGLLALVAAIAMSRLLSRSIVGPIRRLTTAASDAATTGLPTAVNKIEQEGGDTGSIEVPTIELDTGDELEQLATSFNSVQGTAVRLASEQAVNRRNTADMFVNLGRRNNSLLKRQLRFIDSLERNEADPETLESLFKLDHLATRMRRNAESLLVLAGERSPRRWSAPIRVRDAIQAALAEVEEYERADMNEVGDGLLQGNVVADVAHILAELVENALNFSPPQTNVTIHGREDNGGYTITVSDEGIGMAPEEIDEINERLAVAHELSQVPAQHIGLYVVGRLASQHDIKVSLSRAASGGTMATIELPAAITSEADLAKDGAADDEVDPANISDEEAKARAMLKEAEEKLAAIAKAKEASGDEAIADTEVEESPSEDATTATTSDDDDGTPSDATATESTPEQNSNDGEDVDQAMDDGIRVLDETPAEQADDDTTTQAAAHRADDQDETAAAARRGPDDSPVESVTVAGVEIPRRRSEGKRKAKAESGAAVAAKAEGADDKAGSPVGSEAKAKSSGRAATTENGQVDGEKASDQDGAAKGRGKSDRTDAEADESEGTELEKFGFTRRGSDGTSPESAEQAAVTMVAKATADDSEEEVEETATESRNQWSSFQKGKEAAEAGPADEA